MATDCSTIFNVVEIAALAEKGDAKRGQVSEGLRLLGRAVYANTGTLAAATTRFQAAYKEYTALEPSVASTSTATKSQGSPFDERAEGSLQRAPTLEVMESGGRPALAPALTQAEPAPDAMDVDNPAPPEGGTSTFKARLATVVERVRGRHELSDCIKSTLVHF